MDTIGMRKRSMGSSHVTQLGCEQRGNYGPPDRLMFSPFALPPGHSAHLQADSEAPRDGQGSEAVKFSSVIRSSPEAGLLLRNLNSVTIIQMPCYLPYP